MIYSNMLNTSVGLLSMYIAIYYPEELPKELKKKIKSLTVVGDRKESFSREV